VKIQQITQLKNGGGCKPACIVQYVQTKRVGFLALSCLRLSALTVCSQMHNADSF